MSSKSQAQFSLCEKRVVMCLSKGTILAEHTVSGFGFCIYCAILQLQIVKVKHKDKVWELVSEIRDLSDVEGFLQ